MIRNLDFRTKITFQGIKGQAAIDQIKAVDKKRIVKILGHLRASDQRKLLVDLLFFSKISQQKNNIHQYLQQATGKPITKP